MRSGSIFDHCSFGEFLFKSKVWITDSSGNNVWTYVYSTSAIVTPVTWPANMTSVVTWDFRALQFKYHPPGFMREEPDMHGFRLQHNTALPSSLKRGTIYHFYHAYQMCFYTCMWMYIAQCSLNIYIGIWCHDGSSWNVRLNVVQQVNEAPIYNKFEIRRVAHLPGNFFIAFEFFTWIFLHFGCDVIWKLLSNWSTILYSGKFQRRKFSQILRFCRSFCEIWGHGVLWCYYSCCCMKCIKWSGYH